jgi:nucleotide-binding universal stress UspA family protein
MAMIVKDVSRPAPPAIEARPINRVLVAFDGSPGAWAALEQGIAVAVSQRALLTIAGVVEEPTLWIGMGPAAMPYTHQTMRRDAERHMDQLLAAARDEVPATVSVTTQMLHGKPGRALSAFAESGCYDLVIVGPRPDSRLRRLLGGSVTRALLSRVRSSVLAVKAPVSES